MEVVATEVAATVASMAASEWEVVATVAAPSVVATAGWAMESVTVGHPCYYTAACPLIM